MNTEQTTPPEIHSEPSKARVACSILLVEDSPDMVRLVQTYLSDPRIALTVAMNGREGIEAVQKSVFDLVLMDIGLPDMDGYAAIREIRKWETANSSSRTPVAALTAISDFDESTRILAAGFTLHLVKPITRQTLLQIVSQYGARARSPKGEKTVRPEKSADQAVRELVPEYLSNLNQMVAQMESAMEDRAYGQVRTFAHQIKGTGSAFGFPIVSEYGKQIEKASAMGDGPTIVHQLSSLNGYLKQAAATLELAATR
jgi:CheY-like chemotaxis protein